MTAEKFGHIWAKVGRSRLVIWISSRRVRTSTGLRVGVGGLIWVYLGMLGRQWYVICLVGGCACPYRSRRGKPGWVRLIRQRRDMFCGCAFADLGVGVGNFGYVWTRVGKTVAGMGGYG